MSEHCGFFTESCGMYSQCQHSATIVLHLTEHESTALCEYHAGHLAALAANRLWDENERGDESGVVA